MHFRGWAKFIDWFFHEEVGGAYREETTANQVIGHGIEFSLPLIGPLPEAPTAQQHRVWCSDWFLPLQTMYWIAAPLSGHLAKLILNKIKINALQLRIASTNIYTVGIIPNTRQAPKTMLSYLNW